MKTLSKTITLSMMTICLSAMDYDPNDPSRREPGDTLVSQTQEVSDGILSTRLVILPKKQSSVGFRHLRHVRHLRHLRQVSVAVAPDLAAIDLAAIDLSPIVRLPKKRDRRTENQDEGREVPTSSSRNPVLPRTTSVALPYDPSGVYDSPPLATKRLKPRTSTSVLTRQVSVIGVNVITEDSDAGASAATQP